VGELCKLPCAALEKVRSRVVFAFAAYNPVRLGGIGVWWDLSPT
jgi:hypothetical protein